MTNLIGAIEGYINEALANQEIKRADLIRVSEEIYASFKNDGKILPRPASNYLLLPSMAIRIEAEKSKQTTGTISVVQKGWFGRDKKRICALESFILEKYAFS